MLLDAFLQLAMKNNVANEMQPQQKIEQTAMTSLSFRFALLCCDLFTEKIEKGIDSFRLRYILKSTVRERPKPENKRKETMTTYYLKAHYTQGDMFERYEGEAEALYEQVTNDLSDPENFTYTISSDPINDFDPCTLDDLKKWAGE